MNLETVTQRQQDLNHTLKSLIQQLETIVDKIAGERDENKEIEKPIRLTNGLLDTLYFLQEENKESLQYLSDVIRSLAESTWQPSMPEETGCIPISSS